MATGQATQVVEFTSPVDERGTCQPKGVRCTSWFQLVSYDEGSNTSVIESTLFGNAPKQLSGHLAWLGFQLAQ